MIINHTTVGGNDQAFSGGCIHIKNRTQAGIFGKVVTQITGNPFKRIITNKFMFQMRLDNAYEFLGFLYGKLNL